MTIELKNTFVIRTDDKKFEKALISFLTEHCNDNEVNAAYFNLNEEGANKVMEIVNA